MSIAAKDGNGAALTLNSTTTAAGEAPGSTPVDPTTGAPFKASSEAAQTTGNNSLASIESKTPALGQALAAASTPVVLTAAQVSTLTPPAAISGFGLEATQLNVLAKLNASVAVTGTFWQANQPVSFTWAGLTDAQLRASNVPVSLNSLAYPASTSNSSVAQLAAAAAFTGAIESIQNLQAAQISVTCDQAYTVQVQQFIDVGGTKLVSTDTFTRAAGVPMNENVTLPGDFFRIVLTNNGAGTTTTLQLSTTFGIMNTQPRALTNAGRFPVEAFIQPALLSSYNVVGVIAINTVLLTLDCSQYRSVSVQCTSMGTSGVVTPEYSNDNATWVAATMFTSAGTSAATFNAAGLWVIPVFARYIRLRLSTATTAGTTTLSTHLFDTPIQEWLATQPVSGTVTATANVTGYPTAAASADALANPTVTQIGAAGLVFNGTTWDRVRGMSGNLTTGDTGAKVATGNGATLTNVGNKGVQVLVNMGAVTGTTPTAVLKLQGSVDGGTNWFDIPGATTASLTATGLYGITVYPGIAANAGTTTTGTTATVSAVMPRTWRVVWTLGGTSPSFTITNIQYNYLNN